MTSRQERTWDRRATRHAQYDIFYDFSGAYFLDSDTRLRYVLVPKLVNYLNAIYMIHNFIKLRGLYAYVIHSFCAGTVFATYAVSKEFRDAPRNLVSTATVQMYHRSKAGQRKLS